MTRRPMKPSRSFLCRSAGSPVRLPAPPFWSRLRLDQKGKRASILILVAWVLCLLAVYAVALGATARRQLLFSRRLVLDADLRRAAEAGLNRARALLARHQDAAAEGEEGSSRLWMEREELFNGVSVGSAVFSLGYTYIGAACGESRFFYGLADEEGKVNLNTSGPEMLARLFEAVLCASPSQAQELADAVVDWRDPDSAVQPNGAEDGFYAGLPTPYGCKDAPFDSPDELLLVRGFDATMYKNIKGYVTAFGAGRLNINTAPAQGLQALGLDAKLVGKIVRYRRGPDARWGTLDDGLFASSTGITEDLAAFAGLTDQERVALEQIVAAHAFTVTSSYFSATCTAQRPQKEGAFFVSAVFERTLTEEGYDVQPRYWRTFF